MLSPSPDPGAPAALPPPPRTVRGHAGWFALFARILILPISLFAIGMTIVHTQLHGHLLLDAVRGGAHVELSSPAVGIALVLGFFDAYLLVTWYALWVLPLRERRLLARGTPAPGRVIESRRGRYGYMVRYAYRGPAGEERKGRMAVSARAWKAVETMQVVTVLYWPEKPARSVVYELSRYRVES